MATPGMSFYNNNDHYVQQNTSVKGRITTLPTSVVIPKVPQSTQTRDQYFHQQQRQFTPPTNLGQCRADQEYYGNNQHSPSSHLSNLTNSSVHMTTPETQVSNSTANPRSEGLKRRSSLREAARSLKPSKVATRLRRHVRGGFDPEDGDDASASASENDHAVTPLSKSRTNNVLQQDCKPVPRIQSPMSNLMDGLQSSLTLGSQQSRDRGSSMASQASSRIFDVSDSASTHTSFTTASSISKRSRSTCDEDLDAYDNHDSDRVGKRPCQTSMLESEQPHLFACPFAKHDPKRYSAANLDELNYRGCSQSYLTDLARVKQHLYRVHERPQHHCPTCFEMFKNQAQCMKHIAARCCHSRPCPFNEKMSPDQLATIKKKNRGTDPYLGWYEIYKTLFPGAQLPMSPYAAFTATVDSFESFVEYIMRELPARLQHQLGYGNPILDSVQESLPDILRDIRRDYNPAIQLKSEPSTQDDSESNSVVTENDDASPELNFHEMVTMADQTNQLGLDRSAVMALPDSEIFAYPQAPPPQLLPNAALTQTLFPSQGTQHVSSQPYSHQHMGFNLPSSSMVQVVNTQPLTAIWQPEERENPNGYFTNHHQNQQHLPAYTIQIESEGSWIPGMVTAQMNNPIDDDTGVQGMLGRYYQGGFR